MLLLLLLLSLAVVVVFAAASISWRTRAFASPTACLSALQTTSARPTQVSSSALNLTNKFAHRHAMLILMALSYVDSFSHQDIEGQVFTLAVVRQGQGVGAACCGGAARRRNSWFHAGIMRQYVLFVLFCYEGLDGEFRKP